MKIETLRAVLNTGDKHGSGIRQMLADLKICDLSNVTQEQAECWLKEREYDKQDNREDSELV